VVVVSDDKLGGFALPPFNADNALAQIKRGLRDMKLAERGNVFELRGKHVVELAPEDGAIAVRLARRLALTPDWDRLRVSNANEQRKLLDEIKKRMTRWDHED
jgi:hypothetical protein